MRVGGSGFGSGPDVGVSPERSGWLMVAVSTFRAFVRPSRVLVWESAGEGDARPPPAGLLSVGSAFGTELRETSEAFEGL